MRMIGLIMLGFITVSLMLALRELKPVIEAKTQTIFEAAIPYLKESRCRKFAESLGGYEDTEAFHPYSGCMYTKN